MNHPRRLRRRQSVDQEKRALAIEHVQKPLTAIHAE
jgi:hypothetical protein